MMNRIDRQILTATIAMILAVSSVASHAKAPPGQGVYDIVVYGDSSGAVIAAVAAKRQGRSVILVNPTHFLGGMSASGLGATDFLGQRRTFGGIASEFYDAIAAEYGKAYVRSFEPHGGPRVFDRLVEAVQVPVVFNEPLNRATGVTMEGQRIVSITTLSGKTYHGKMFIDATYVGDLLAAAGVTYTVGREAASQSGEDVAHGSIRMEPVFMVLGQSAATAAGLVLAEGVGVQDLAYTVLRARLESDKQQF